MARTTTTCIELLRRTIRPISGGLAAAILAVREPRQRGAGIVRLRFSFLARPTSASASSA